MTLVPLFSAIKSGEIKLKKHATISGDFTVEFIDRANGAHWNDFVDKRKREIRHVLSQIQQAYSEGIPEDVPLLCCRLCECDPYPVIRVTFRDDKEGWLCVACYLREIAPDVNRTRCDICEKAIQSNHRRDYCGGLTCCSECFTTKLPMWRKVRPKYPADARS